MRLKYLSISTIIMVTRKSSALMSYLISLLALSYLNHQIAFASPSITTEKLAELHQWSHNKSSVSTLTCPEPLDISPCICQSDNLFMIMDCSKISSTDELKDIFSQKFPYNDFTALIIEENKNLQVLCSDCFGETSFERVYIINVDINTIEPNVFHGSYSTLQELSVEDTNITEFPFDEIEKFTVLEGLHLSGNQIVTIDQFNSTSLVSVSFKRNKQIHHIPFDSFHHLPKVQYIDFDDCSIESIHPYTFTEMPELRRLYLLGNNLSEIQDVLIKLNTDDNSYLDLQYNSIRNISAGAISGVTNSLHFEYNDIQTLDEETWRPLLEETQLAYFSGNPLSCGCDIAWLILNEDYMNKIDNDATCNDGQLLKDLDPVLYELYC